MAHETQIHVPKRPSLRLERKRVLPSAGHMPLNCINCNSFEFGLHVEPVDGSARIVELVCARCKNVVKVDLETGLLNARRAKIQLKETQA